MQALHGGYLYSHHDVPQTLFPLRLTALARRGRTMRGAPGSRVPQRGGIAGPSTRLQNLQIQAQKENGRYVSLPDYSGPGRPGRHRSKARNCAPDARDTFPIGRPTGSGATAPGNFGYFPSMESSSPEGETSPIPRPARRRSCV